MLQRVCKKKVIKQTQQALQLNVTKAGVEIDLYSIWVSTLLCKSQKEIPIFVLPSTQLRDKQQQSQQQF
jgi:hypothetical protein